jgi:GNAT superfamily N-acetyltransferase
LPSDFDHLQAESIINSEKNVGVSLSYYIPDNFLSAYTKYFQLSGNHVNISSDYYIFRHVEQKLSPIGELVLVNDQTIQEYVHMAKICFPEWANNEEYANHMYYHQKNNRQLVVRNYLLQIDNKFVGFCGIIGSEKNNLAYFHNTGVLPEFRRKGYFTAMIQHLINTTISFGISDTYALVENESSSHHGLIKLGYTVQDKYHLFST